MNFKQVFLRGLCLILLLGICFVVPNRASAADAGTVSNTKVVVLWLCDEFGGCAGYTYNFYGLSSTVYTPVDTNAAWITNHYQAVVVMNGRYSPCLGPYSGAASTDVYQYNGSSYYGTLYQDSGGGGIGNPNDAVYEGQTWPNWYVVQAFLSSHGSIAGTGCMGWNNVDWSYDAP
ncbi:hypothetical protein [Nitrolancea hollandica]|uniref:Uncharacterized protein n=1 Tax=Nitrolancea hollandica Lb TaxID=1129897 RepID=I4EGF8_9BACT|nr:hypothetical protein [Nitrolancea hollandica]CCF83770.1 exported hypothetical protein [Nitrolancea hollandica Lb]